MPNPSAIHSGPCEWTAETDFICARCKRLCCACVGCDDDEPDVCDDCYGKEWNMPMSVRDEVQKFAEVMEQKLRENDHKGHWRGCPFEQLAQRLVEEFDELLVAVNAGQHPVNVAREAADVANFAMMIADNYRHAHDAMKETTESLKESTHV